MKKRFSTLAMAFALPLLAVAGVANAANITTVVMGNTAAGENQPGWLFNRDLSTSTPYVFTTDEAQIGQGSLYVQPISGTTASNKFIGENFINKPVADVEAISFDFKLGAGVPVAKANRFYINVYANFGVSDDLKYYDCRYDIVATTGSDSDWTTLSFDPTSTYPVTTRTGGSASPLPCPSSPAAMDSLSPGSNIRMFAVTVGDTSLNDANVSGYLDKVVVDAAGDVTTYDFEPTLTPSTKDDCKDGGWKTFNTPVFKNQGACVSAVSSKGKNSLLNLLTFWN